MPYIHPDYRKRLDTLIVSLAQTIFQDNDLWQRRAGVVNYVITQILKLAYSERYEEFNEAIGVLECVKQEMYRRRIAPYEDQKIQENTDVY